MPPRESLVGIYRDVEIWDAMRRGREESEHTAVLRCIELYLQEDYGSDGMDVLPRVNQLRTYDSLIRFYIRLIRAGCLRDAIRSVPSLPDETA